MPLSHLSDINNAVNGGPLLLTLWCYIPVTLYTKAQAQSVRFAVDFFANRQQINHVKFEPHHAHMC